MRSRTLTQADATALPRSRTLTQADATALPRSRPKEAGDDVEVFTRRRDWLARLIGFRTGQAAKREAAAW